MFLLSVFFIFYAQNTVGPHVLANGLQQTTPGGGLAQFGSIRIDSIQILCGQDQFELIHIQCILQAENDGLQGVSALTSAIKLTLAGTKEWWG